MTPRDLDFDEDGEIALVSHEDATAQLTADIIKSVLRGVPCAVSGCQRTPASVFATGLVTCSEHHADAVEMFARRR